MEEIMIIEELDLSNSMFVVTQSFELIVSDPSEKHDILKACSTDSLFADLEELMESSSTETGSSSEASETSQTAISEESATEEPTSTTKQLKQSADEQSTQLTADESAQSTSKGPEKNPEILDPALVEVLKDVLDESIRLIPSPSEVPQQASLQKFPPTAVPPPPRDSTRVLLLKDDYTGYFPGYGYFEVIPPQFGHPLHRIKWYCRDPPPCVNNIEYPSHSPDAIEMVRERAIQTGHLQLANILKTYLDVTSNALQISELLSALPGWELLLKSACWYGEYYERENGDCFCAKCYCLHLTGKVKLRMVHQIISRTGLMYIGCNSCLVPLHRARDIVCCPDCLLTFGIGATLSPDFTNL